MATHPPHNVLFLCTGNSARSVMSEALLTTMGRGRFVGYSAGSQPTGTVNPFAVELIANTGYDLSKLRSKSWDEFALSATPGVSRAPNMDFIITVCGNAAGETCPYWPGHPATAHWGYEDPAAVLGTDANKRAAFQKVFQQITARIQRFMALPLESLDAAAIQRELKAIGAHAPVIA
jgi:arsenate reductase (thioredoxin)